MTASIPAAERVIALDRVLAFLDSSAIRPKNVTGLKADPPVVFSSTRTAILVNIDGEPIWSPIANNDLRFAVNTNWDLFEHAPSASFYLRHEKTWLKATEATGPWSVVSTLPASFNKLPADDNWKDVKATLPVQKAAAPAVPIVFVSTTPAELILLRGAATVRGRARHEAVVGAQHRIGRVPPRHRRDRCYYLVAGRWFSAPGFDGPWTFASLTLPEDFKQIPLEHERSRVLASVPGTVQAAEAVLLAQVPQTARVNKKELKPPDVGYQGEPAFEPIETTSVARATNTDKDIFKIGNLYYMCFQGVWFMSQTPNGPWEVTGSVPQADLRDPCELTRRITSPTSRSRTTTTSGSRMPRQRRTPGVMVGWGCAVWGTGYYYPPYVWYGGCYPAYFPYYPTYGYSAWYNPWTGAYGRGVASVRSLRRRRHRRALQPAHRHLRTRRSRVRTVRRARRRPGVQPANRHLRRNPPGRGRVRQLGIDRRAARRPVGRDVPGDQQPHRHDHPRDARQRGWRRGHPPWADVGAASSVRPAAATSTPAVTATSIANRVIAGRSTTTARGAASIPRRRSGASRPPRVTPDRTSQSAPARRADPATMSQLDRDSAARRDGAQRTTAATTARSGSSGARSGSYRPAGGARGGGGRRR